MTIRTIGALLCGAVFVLTTQTGALAAEDKTKTKKAGSYHLVANCEDKRGKLVKNKNCTRKPGHYDYFLK